MEELISQSFDVLTKLSSLWGSFLGTTIFLGFLKPKTKREAIYRILVSVVTAASLTSFIHEVFSILVTWQISLGIGFMLGVMSWVFFSFLKTTNFPASFETTLSSS